MCTTYAVVRPTMSPTWALVLVSHMPLGPLPPHSWRSPACTNIHQILTCLHALARRIRSGPEPSSLSSVSACHFGPRPAILGSTLCRAAPVPPMLAHCRHAWLYDHCISWARGTPVAPSTPSMGTLCPHRFLRTPNLCTAMNGLELRPNLAPFHCCCGPLLPDLPNHQHARPRGAPRQPCPPPPPPSLRALPRVESPPRASAVAPTRHTRRTTASTPSTCLITTCTAM